MSGDPSRILTTSNADRPGPSHLSWFAFAFGMISAASATIALLIVSSGTSDPEDRGYLRTFIDWAMGRPIVAVSIVAGILGLVSLVSHKRHGMPLILPVATMALSAFSLIVCATLPP